MYIIESELEEEAVTKTKPETSAKITAGMPSVSNRIVHGVIYMIVHSYLEFAWCRSVWRIDNTSGGQFFS